MAASKRRSAKDLFGQVVELDPSERARYLDEHCDDEALRARVVRLLENDACDMKGFLNSPVVSAVSPTGCGTEEVGDSNLALGAKIGPYKLLQQVGEGGFGVVFMAEQEEPVRRRVALKVIKAGMDTKAVIARFEIERQALALMDHPSIARVLDAGSTASGRPYFVMELVKGVPITEFCDEAELDTRRRLELFCDVCRAVQHAHQKGVIHRDLKPSNILITLRDDEPQVKIIDFGIAKATGQKLTEKTLFTAYGQMIGTPVYMSPEQAVISEFDVDTRSDVYSLGILLYELLTGLTPIDPEALRNVGFDELRRMIREETPSKPSTKLSTLTPEVKLAVAARRRASPRTLRKECDGDLDWIVLKALEKERARRYASASAFAEDIERHLRSEPVSAAAPSTSYKLRRFVRRNRRSVAAAAVVFFILVVATIFSSWLAWVADQALDDKEKALAAEEAERRRAEERLTQIENANGILSSIFEGLDPVEIHESHRPLQDVIADKLDRAINDLVGDSTGDPLVVAETQASLGRALLALGKPNRAVAVLERVRDTLRMELGAKHPDTLASMSRLAAGYEAAGQLKRSLPLRERVFELSREKLGADHIDTLTSMNNLAVSYELAGQLERSLPLKRQVFEAHREKLGADHPETLTSMSNLAVGYLVAGQPERSIPLHERVFELMKAKLGPDHPHAVKYMGNLAAAYDAVGQLKKSLALHQQVLALLKEKLGADHPDTLTSMNNLAEGYRAAGQLEKSTLLHEQVFELTKAKLGTEHPHTLFSMSNLALSYQVAGQLERSIPLQEKNFHLMRGKLGADHPDTLRTMSRLARSYGRIGWVERALALLENVLELRKAKLGADHPATLGNMHTLALGYGNVGQLDKAIVVAEELVDLSVLKLGASHPDAVSYREDFALLEKIATAHERYRAKLEANGSTHIDTLLALRDLAQCYMATGGLSQAESMLLKILKGMKDRAKDDAIKRFTVDLLGRCLSARGPTNPSRWLTHRSQSIHGAALLEIEEYAEAERLLVVGYEGLVLKEPSIPEADRGCIPDALERLVEFYDARAAEGDSEMVAKYRKLLEKRRGAGKE